jgi:hypothetical protein
MEKNLILDFTFYDSLIYKNSAKEWYCIEK